MPHVNGLEATRQIHQAFPDIKIVMLTMHADHSVSRPPYAGVPSGTW